MPDPSAQNATAVLPIADLIDLQVREHDDARRPHAELRQRDRRIGLEINARALDDAAAVHAWLGHVARQKGASVGQACERWRRTLTTIGCVAAFLIGFATVSGWLLAHTGQSVNTSRPVNVIHFWAALVGVQLLLLALWVWAMFRWRRETRSPAHRMGHEPRLPVFAALFAWVWRRVAARSGAARVAMEGLAGSIGRIRAVYGDLIGWVFVGAIQSVAIWFNVGAIAGLVLLATVSDPGFGWRSTLLGPDQVHAIARVVASPWSWAVAAPPDLDAVGFTQYSSLDDRFIGLKQGAGQGAGIWAAWLPMLFASMVFYGLTPRIISWGWCAIRGRRAHRSAEWRTGYVRLLLSRLREPEISTTALGAGEDRIEDDRLTPANGLDAIGATGERVVVMRWTGVRGDDAMLRDAVARRMAAEAQPRVITVGSADLDAEHAAVGDAVHERPNAAVALIVEGWEPPVGDYTDFLRGLRGLMGDGRLIVVFVAGVSGTGEPDPPDDEEFDLWRRRLGLLGDPWLAVEPLAMGDPAAPARGADA